MDFMFVFTYTEVDLDFAYSEAAPTRWSLPDLVPRGFVFFSKNVTF
jgi:hypothetical protein